jgi:hypothetical protein
MKAKSKFLNQPLDFWANVKFISQKIGYTDRKSSVIKVPTIKEIIAFYNGHGLNSNKIFMKNNETVFGNLLIEYFQHRADFLNDFVRPNLLDKDKAKKLFKELYDEYRPKCPLPLNKQKGDKKTYAFFTGIINILIEANLGRHECNYDPKELTVFTKDNLPIRSLSRRADGAFPNVINPIAIWEIKEYYYTTTFGSRVADGIYETMLDGYELAEIRRHLKRDINHYLMVDDYYTWWTCGRSYLCRICDMLHMGLLTEAIFGHEVVERLPQLVNSWVRQINHKI